MKAPAARRPLVLALATVVVVSLLIGVLLGDRHDGARDVRTPRDRAAPQRLAPPAGAASVASRAPAGAPAPSPAEPERLATPGAGDPRPLAVLTAERDDAAPERWTPVPDVAVELALQAGVAHGTALAAGLTGADGRVALAVPRLAWRAATDDDGVVRLCLRTRRTGYLPAHHHTAVRADDIAAEPLVPLERGALVPVRVLDAAGAPAAGAAWIGAPPEPDRGPGTEVDADGRAQLAVRAPGTYAVFARGAGARTPAEQAMQYPPFHAGTGVSVPFEVRLDAPPGEPVEVWLRGAGVLRGRVRGHDGAASAGLLVVARHVDPEPSGAAGDDWARLAHRARGALHAQTRTDVDGRFELRGLHAGRYHLGSFRPGWRGSQQLIELAPEGLPADGSEHALVFGRPHLVIQLRDAAGAPFTDAEGLPFGAATHPPDTWPRAPRVHVAEVAPPPVLRDLERALFGPGALGGGVFVIEVDAGARYDVGVLGAQLPWRPVRAGVPVGSTRSDVTVGVPEPAERGAIELAVRAPGGEPVSEPIRLRVLHPATGAALLEQWRQPRFASGPWHVQLPAETYELHVQAEIPQGHLGPRGARPFGGVRETVTVPAGHGLRVELTLGAGARLRVTTRGAPSPADVQAARAALGAGADSAEVVDFWSRFVFLELRAQGHAPRSVEFRLRDPQEFLGQRRSFVASGLPLGETQLSERLTAGRATLVARLPGGRELRHELELTDGATTEVLLDFR